MLSNRVGLFLVFFPSLYFISPLFACWLINVKLLPMPAKLVLLVFMLSQLVSAFLSSNPIHSFILVFLKSFLILGCIGFGATFRLRETRAHLSKGLLIVIGISLLYSFGVSMSLSTGILHPYMTSSTLGICGVFLFYFYLFGGVVRNIFYWIVLFLSGFVVILSGSRLSILTLLIGLAMAILLNPEKYKFSRRYVSYVSLFVFLFFCCVYFFRDLVMVEILRLDDSGRSSIWYSALSMLKHMPFGGVGAYGAGSYIYANPSNCDSFNQNLSFCHELLGKLGKPWLTLHNTPLQQLVESGVIGFSGFYLLISAVFWGALKSKNSLVISITTGALFLSSYENVILVPTPFFGEIFWIFSGYGLMNFNCFAFKKIVAVSVLISILSILPILTLFSPSHYQEKLFNFAILDSSNELTYSVSRQKDYRISLFSCKDICSLIDVYSSGSRENDFYTHKIPLEKTNPDQVKHLRLVAFSNTFPPYIISTIQVKNEN